MRKMEEDDDRALPRTGAARAVDLRGRQAAARARDLGAWPARRSALHDRPSVQRHRPPHGLHAGRRRRGDPARARLLHARALPGRRCSWSTADGSGDRSWTSSEFVDGDRALARAARRRARADLQPRQPAQRRHHPRARAARSRRRTAKLRPQAAGAAARVGQRRGVLRTGLRRHRGANPVVAKAARLLGWRAASHARGDAAGDRRRLSGAIRADVRRPRGPRRRGQPAGAGDEAGRGRAGLQRRPPPAGRGRAHRRRDAPPACTGSSSWTTAARTTPPPWRDALARRPRRRSARAAAPKRRLRRGDEGRPRRGAAAGADRVATHPCRRAIQPGGARRAARRPPARGLDLLQGSRIAGGDGAGGRHAPLQDTPATRAQPAREPRAGVRLTDYHSGYLAVRPARARRSCRSRGCATASISTWR